MHSPSPFQLALLLLIKDSYCEASEDDEDGEEAASLDEISLQHLAAFLSREVSASERACMRSLPELLDALTAAVPGPSGVALATRLHTQLENLCASPDDVLDATSSLATLLNKPSHHQRDDDGAGRRPLCLGRASPMGLFLRKFLLALNMGQFPCLSKLYESLVAYVDGDAFSNLKQTRPMSDKNSGALQAARLSGGEHLTPRQLQLWAHSRALKLERDVGSASFESVEAEVGAILKLVPDLPRAFLLRALNCAMHKHQAGAFEALHKFFDFALRHGGPTRGAQGGHHLRVQDSVAIYAVLNKAGLHWQFGQYGAAAAAVEETVRIAQENGNGHAMAHALAWLHMVMASQRHPKAVHVLQRCAATCADHGLSLEDVEASVNLSIAKAIALTPSMPGCSSPGGGDSPAVTRDRLWACLPPSPQTSDASELGTLQSEAMTSRRLLVASAVCAGHARLSLIGAAAVLSAHAEGGAAAAEVTTAMATVARLQEQFDSSSSGSRPFALDVQKDDSSEANQSNNAPLYDRPPLAALATARSRFPAAHSQLFALPVATLAYQQHLKGGGNSSGHFNTKAMLNVLDSVSAPRAFSSAREGSFLAPFLAPRTTSVAGSEASSAGRKSSQSTTAVAPFAASHFEALEARAKHMCAHQRNTAALELLSALQGATRSCALPASTRQLLLDEAQVRLRGCQQPATALVPLLQCLAARHGQLFGAHHHAQALVSMAEVYFSWGQASHAAVLCRAALPKVMEHGTAQERGKAMLLLGKCHLQQLTDDISDLRGARTRKHVAKTRQVLRSLQCAKRHFEKAGMQHPNSKADLVETLYLIARTYGTIPSPNPGVIALRDSAAAAFLALQIGG